MLGGCRRHGPECRTPWGYDRDHTDSDRPYTLDELAARVEPPHRYAYPTVDDYRAAFHLYRVLRWDGMLNADERAARLRAMGEHLGLSPADIDVITAR